MSTAEYNAEAGNSLPCDGGNYLLFSARFFSVKTIETALFML